MQQIRFENFAVISDSKKLSIDKRTHLMSQTIKLPEILYIRSSRLSLISGYIPSLVTKLERLILKIQLNEKSDRINGDSFASWDIDTTYIVSESQYKKLANRIKINHSFIVSNCSNILSNEVDPSSFWSAVNQTGYTIVVVQRFIKGQLIYSEEIKLGTKFVASENQERAKKVARVLVAESMNLNNHISKNSVLKSYPPKISYLNLAKYLLKKCTKKIFPFLANKEISQWQVRVDEIKDEEVLEKSWIIGDGTSSLIADPFLFTHQNSTYCFVEEIEASNSKGHIAVFKLENSEWKRLGIALEEDSHLSFPFLFEHDNVMYMVPENSKKKEINLYRAIKFPLKWEKLHTIMRGISAADSLIFPHKGKWWLLSNVDSMELGDHNLELFGWFSDSPLSQDWTPIANNPIFRDESISRNGGLVFFEGQIHRVAQDNNSGIYGRSFHLRKIVDITGDAYIEKSVEEDYSIHNVLATHHMSMAENFVARDFRAFSRR
jgi:hypothetical protein